VLGGDALAAESVYSAQAPLALGVERVGTVLPKQLGVLEGQWKAGV
jgi:hypothetical protein